ncbi:MAG: transcription termination/antitermination protein NusA [Clostridia bacterium]|nr:transcription termination/antitermination protein NusA [Clostridia bacterium]
MISSKDFFIALDLLEKERKIDPDYFIKALESALTSAYKKNFGEAQSAEVKLNPEKNTIKVLAYKTVVEEVEDPDKQISLADAKALKSTYKIGDMVSQEVTPKNFGRIAAQTARQVVMQKLREAERTMINTDINSHSEQLTTGIVRRIEGPDVYLELGGFKQEGILSQRDMIPNEQFNIGDRVKVCIKSAKTSFNEDTLIQVTRTTVGFVRKLLELEIPEIESHDIEIKNMVREPGQRTKIAVFSADRNIDPVGACIGNRGARINTIIDELHGEKIDIVRWSDDIFEFIAAALSPAEVISVEIDETTKSSKVIVPDTKLSLAIGKNGVNVRLAVKLTGWKIDVSSESKARELENSTTVQNTINNDITIDDADVIDSNIMDELDTLD